METSPTTHRDAESNAAEVAGYRRLSVLALIGLVLGVLSITALLGLPALWMVPAVGALVSLRALLSIGSQGTLSGRGLASLGLFLSVLFGVAAPVDAWGNRWFLERSARPVTEAWFAALRHGEPEKALQLRTAAGLRRSLNENLSVYYRSNEKAHRELETYVAEPVIKTLLLLGERAQTRLYETSGSESADNRDQLFQVYAVTFDDRGTKTTFFVAITLERAVDFSQQARWRVASAAGGVRPTLWLD